MLNNIIWIKGLVKKATIAFGAILIVVGAGVYIGSANQLIEVSKMEIVAERDHAFTPAVPMLKERYQNLQLASIPIALVGAGILIYGAVKK